MKSPLVALLALLATGNTAHALSINCKSLNTFDGEVYEETANHIVIAGRSEYECRTNQGREVLVTAYGVGPGLRADLGNLVHISCPFISHKKLVKRFEKDKALALFGPEADAGVIVGAKTGFYLNQRGGICALTGVGLGLGASLSINALVIEDATGPGSHTQRQFVPRLLQVFEW